MPSGSAPGSVPPSRPTVAVVGGGIAGLAAAWELVTGPTAAGPDEPVPEVVVLEAGDRLGGKVRSEPFAGRRVDVAADAFLARRPEATDLSRELGLAEELVPVGASGAAIWARGRLRPMPDGLNLGVPTRWWPLLRSGILSPGECLRLSHDLVLPRLGRGGMPFGDRSVGDIVGGRLGRPVVDRLADPLIGGIHAGDADQLSAAALFPVLLAASHQSGSLMRRLGAARVRAAPSRVDGRPPPVFWSLAGTTASLVDELARALVTRGVSLRTGTVCQALDRPTGRRTGRGAGRARWELTLGSAESAPGAQGCLEVDGVILAAPAPETAVLLAPHAPVSAGLLSTIRYASVAVVTLAFREGSLAGPLAGTGFLVPRTSPVEGKAALVTACTYLGRKWPHLARPGDELIRASVGRFGDDRPAALDDEELTAAVLAELGTLLGLGDAPLETMVTRWDRAFPQYEVGHLIRVARIEEDLASRPGLAVAGAALRGVGIPACIGSGRAAARRVLASLGGPAGPGPGDGPGAPAVPPGT
jgi:protoporphyrinogen/coproporphyrinogen III oxidase